MNRINYNILYTVYRFKAFGPFQPKLLYIGNTIYILMIFKMQCVTADIYGKYTIKFEIFSFIQIMANIFSLRPYQVDEISAIFKSTWKYRTSLYNRMKYENVILGICEYVMREDESFNVYTIIPLLYSKEKQSYNSKQVYTISQMLPDILND